jgi:hypothetical protein
MLDSDDIPQLASDPESRQSDGQENDEEVDKDGRYAALLSCGQEIARIGSEKTLFPSVHRKQKAILQELVTQGAAREKLVKETPRIRRKGRPKTKGHSHSCGVVKFKPQPCILCGGKHPGNIAKCPAKKTLEGIVERCKGKKVVDGPCCEICKRKPHIGICPCLKAAREKLALRRRPAESR